MNEDQATLVQPEDTTLLTVCHLLGLALWTGIPFANVLAPLFLWLWKRDTNSSVDEHGKEVMNFQLSMALYILVSGVLCMIVIGFILLPISLITHLVLTIIGGMEANKGQLYRYPLTIRLIK